MQDRLPGRKPQFELGVNLMLENKGLRILVTVVAVVMLAAGSALAASFKLPLSGKIGDAQLEPGRYKITWQQHSPDATVTVAKGKSVVATTEARIEKRANRFDRNSVLYRIHTDGSRSVSEIHLGGTNTAIVFTE